ncbi:hypothetical protein AS592_05285 [Sulfurovum riftiae]|uniref:Thioredoxin-like fold domain-containing protein n=2 Tax=Sulfurovum riftiae TaxID=1630136 RepID=A0A151CEP3_9BACT|nr:hypothetical protein AS592_05285 [Sulfurovum riftiae]
MISSLMAITANDAALVLDAQTSLTNAYKKAKAQKKKLILLVVVKDDCNWCELMVHNTLSDDNVKYELEDMVTVVTDISSKIAQTLDVKLTPSMYFIDASTHRPVHKHIGYEKPGSFIIDIVTAKEKVE